MADEDNAPDAHVGPIPPGQVLNGMKTCSKCKEVKPAATSFWKDPTKKGGYTSWCKQCFSKSSQKRKEQGPEVTVTERECSICKQRKPASAFMKDARRITGLDARCRECRRAQHAARKQRNIEAGNQVWEEKECKRCHVVKPAAMFKRHAYTISGLDSWCKQCCSERRKELLAQKALQHIGDPAAQANKECIQCLHYKPFTDFGKDRAQPDGYNRRCKACEKDTKVGSRRHTREHEDVTDSEDEDNTLLDPTHTHTHTTAGMPRVTRAAAAAAAGGAPLPLPTGLQPFPLPTQAAPTAFTAQAAGNALGLDPRLLFGVPQGTVGGNGNGVVGNGLRVEDWNYLMGAGGNGGGNTGAVGWGVVSTGNAGGGRDGTTVSRELPSFSAGFPALINTNGNAAGSQLLPPVAGLSTQPAGSQPQSQQQVPYNAFATRFESVFREGYDPELYEELVRQDVAIAGAGAGAPADPAVATLATTGLNGDSIVAMMPRSATLEQILNGHYNPSLPSPTGAPPAGAGAAGGSASLLRGMSRQLSVRMDSGAAANPERAASLRDVIDSTRQESLFGMQTGTAGRIDSLLGGAMRVDSNYNANTGPATRFDSLLGGAAKEFFANKAKEAAAAAATAANGVAPPATRAGDAAGAAGGSGAKSSSNSAGSPGLGLPQGSMALSAFGSLADPHALDGLVGRAGPDGVLGDPTRMVSLMSADGMDYALAQLKSRAPSDVSLVDAQSWLGPVPSQAAGPAGASAQQGAVKGSGDKASGEADA